MAVTTFIIFFVVTVSTQALYNPMINENLFEGDIAGVDPNQDRSAIPLDSQRWPNGEIPYVISIDVANKINEIRKVIEHIEEKTCIRFIPRTYEHAYLKFFKGEGCFSFVGRIGKEQPLSLGDGCDTFGVILHETLHAVGFDHEHKRSDRDDYIKIYWENIPKKWHYAFEKLKPNQNRLLTEFDYESIMLYGSYGFAIDPRKPSMTRKDGTILPEPHHKTSMSRLDAKRINILYECNKHSM